MSEELSELLKVRREKLDKLKEKGINPFAYKFDRTHFSTEIIDSYKDLAEGSISDCEVAAAGRIMTKRGHGKASFANIMDDSGKIQIYCRQDVLGDDKYDIYTHLDMGDFIGVKGKVFKTKTGEVTIRVTDFEVLTKSLHPLPEKWHGLVDKELRYRERYVDLIVNKEVRDIFVKRSKIIANIRNYLNDRGFLEVETPILHAQPGGAAAKPFKTYHNTLDMPLFMRIAPELYLKRLLVGGFEKIYELGRSFRNEGMSFKHNPEYTMLEIYQAYIDYEDVMTLCEEIIVTAAKEILGTLQIEFDGKTIDLTPPWKRIKIVDAIKHYSGLDITLDDTATKKFAEHHGIEGASDLPIGKVINLIYDKFVEPNLVQPTFIVDYPIETSPLAKKKRDNPKLVERFELIISGMEIANAFSELNDPIDQRARFEQQLAAKKAGDDETESMDEDFLLALEYGMPPAGGLGIGIDRLVMILTNSSSIRDVILFPQMRPVVTENKNEG